MSSEELQLIQQMLTELGGQAKLVLILWMVKQIFTVTIGWIGGLALVVVLARALKMFIPPYGSRGNTLAKKIYKNFPCDTNGWGSAWEGSDSDWRVVNRMVDDLIKERSPT